MGCVDLSVRRCLSPLISEAILLSIVLVWASIILAAPSFSTYTAPPKPPLLQPIYWNSTAVVARVVEPGITGFVNNSNLELYFYDESTATWCPVNETIHSCFYLKTNTIIMLKLLNNSLQMGVLGCKGSYIVIDYSLRKISVITS